MRQCRPRLDKAQGSATIMTAGLARRSWRLFGLLLAAVSLASPVEAGPEAALEKPSAPDAFRAAEGGSSRLFGRDFGLVGGIGEDPLFAYDDGGGLGGDLDYAVGGVDYARGGGLGYAFGDSLDYATGDGLDYAIGEDSAFAFDTAPPRALERRWSLHIDNDLFAFTRNDRDYTGGIAFTLTGDDVRRYRWTPTKPLNWLDDKLGVDAMLGPNAQTTPALQFGLLLFTPQDLEKTEPILDDRPYASLLYVSSSKLSHEPGENVAIQSTLTLGFLGLPLAADIHRAVHQAVGDNEPKGYSHQISAGGEPTLRYSVSRYQLLAAGRARHPYAIRFDTEASFGYLTEANAEVAFRWGNTGVPWWESSTESGDYAGQPVVTGRRSPARADKATFQLSAGVKLRGRLYNSFIQGQFRDSDVAYSSSDVDHVLFETWLGVDVVFRNNLALSYVLRRQTAEIETGRGARAFTWADLSIAKRF